VQDVLVVEPQPLRDLPDDPQPLRDVLVGLLEGLQLVEDVAEDELDHFQVVALCGPVDRLLDCPQKALLLVVAGGGGVELLDVLEAAVEGLELFEVLERVRVGQEGGDELRAVGSTSFCLGTMVWNCCWAARRVRELARMQSSGAGWLRRRA
jgi:hypothetical protein